MDTDIAKLKQYHTAYSPLDKRYVEIINVWADENGKPVLECRLQGTGSLFTFREAELSQFCL